MRTRSFWRPSLLGLFFFALVAGCAPAVEGGATARANPNLITREELAEVGVTNLYDAIQRLRPNWLRSRGQTTITQGAVDIVVYQGTTQLGGVDALRQIAPGYPAAIRFLDSSTATNTLPGLGSRRVAGAIVIELPR
jgi:hypothetical protein